MIVAFNCMRWNCEEGVCGPGNSFGHEFLRQNYKYNYCQSDDWECGTGGGVGVVNYRLQLAKSKDTNRGLNWSASPQAIPTTGAAYLTLTICKEVRPFLLAHKLSYQIAPNDQTT